MAINPMLVTHIGDWLAANPHVLEGALNRTADVLKTGIPVNRLIGRFGNNLVWRSEGGVEVVGMLEDIGKDIAVIETGQAAISTSLAGLRSLSMITLGFSGLSAGVLLAQCAFLKRRLDVLQKEIRKIQIQIDQTIAAKLDAAVSFAKEAEWSEADSTDYFAEARSKASEAAPYFYGLALDPGVTGGDLFVIQHYSRNYALALSVEFAAIFGTNRIEEMLRRLDAEESRLKGLAEIAYRNVLERHGELYLSAHMRDTVSLSALSDAFTVARDFGFVPADEETTPTAIFEKYRPEICSGSPRLLIEKYKDLKKISGKRFAAMLSIFEESARLLSWRDGLKKMIEGGQDPRSVREELDAFRQTVKTSVSPASTITYAI